jgi:hypothetical protein
LLSTSIFLAKDTFVKGKGKGAEKRELKTSSLFSAPWLMLPNLVVINAHLRSTSTAKAFNLPEIISTVIVCLPM